MYNPNLNFCLNTLGPLINSEIVFFTTCNKIKLISRESQMHKKTQSQEMKEELICICKESIVFLGNKTKGVKRRIYFENLQMVQLNLDKEKHFIFCMVKPLKEVILLYEFEIQNRPVFFEKLRSYYSMYYAQKYGMLQELRFQYINDWSNAFGEHLVRGQGIFPEQSEIKVLNFYRFKLNDKYNYRQNREYPNIFERVFTCDKEEETDINRKYSRKSVIKVIIEKEMPIEKLFIDDSDGDFLFYAYQTLFNYIREYLPSEKVIILDHNEYLKPSPTLGSSEKCSENNKDISQWQTEIFYCRTRPNSQKRGNNYIFIFSRRKFIPPLFETYNDFTFILQEEYINEEGFIHIIPEAVEALREAFDSLEPEVLLPRNAICESFIRKKLEAYMVDPISLNFLYKNGIRGTESYKLGLDYTFKLILMLHDYVKDRSCEAMLEKIKEAYLWQNTKDFNMDGYEKLIEMTDIFSIRETRDEMINKYFDSIDKKTAAMWKNKITAYLSFCANGWLIEGHLSFCDLIQWSRRIPEFSKLINPVFTDLLNLQVITVQNELLELPTIANIVTNIPIVKEITFNNYLMAKLVQFGLLNKIQEVETDIVYFDFLNFILKKNPSRRLLDAVYHYFSAMSEDLGFEATSLKKKSLKLTKTLAKQFSNFYQSSKILKIIAKCLIILAEFDKLNKSWLLNDSMILLISRYLSSPDISFVNTSIKLFSTIFSVIAESKLTFNEIFTRHPSALCKLIHILKGTKVPGSYYRQSTIIYVLDFFISMTTDLSKQEILFEPTYRKFIKYTFRFFWWNPDGEPYSYEIQQRVYELLEVTVTKSSEMKAYIRSHFKLLAIIDKECLRYLEIMDDIFERHNSSQDTKSFMKMQLTMLKLFKNFVENDISLVQNAILNCSNLHCLVQKLMELQDQDEVKPILAQVKDIKENIFGE